MLKAKDLQVGGIYVDSEGSHSNVWLYCGKVEARARANSECRSQGNLYLYLGRMYAASKIASQAEVIKWALLDATFRTSYELAILQGYKKLTGEALHGVWLNQAQVGHMLESCGILPLWGQPNNSTTARTR